MKTRLGRLEEMLEDGNIRTKLGRLEERQEKLAVEQLKVGKCALPPLRDFLMSSIFPSSPRYLHNIPVWLD